MDFHKYKQHQKEFTPEFLKLAPSSVSMRVFIKMYTPKTLPQGFWFSRLSRVKFLTSNSSNSYDQTVQFSSVIQSYSTFCDSMDCSTPSLPVHHQLQELAQTHVYWISNAVQPSHPLLSPSPPVFNHSQHQGLFQESVLRIRWPKYWEFQLHHQSFQWTSRTDFL